MAARANRKPDSPRLRGLLVAGPCWALLVAALWLTPARGGHGTHEQLGVPPCSFLSRTGWPCPSCGMTTSISAMAHGQLARAWTAQPFGVMLFAAIIVGAGFGTFELATNRPALESLRPGAWWGYLLLAGMLTGWGWKCLAGYLSGRYPLP